MSADTVATIIAGAIGSAFGWAVMEWFRGWRARRAGRRAEHEAGEVGLFSWWRR